MKTYAMICILPITLSACGSSDVVSEANDLTLSTEEMTSAEGATPLEDMTLVEEVTSSGDETSVEEVTSSESVTSDEEVTSSEGVTTGEEVTSGGEATSGEDSTSGEEITPVEEAAPVEEVTPAEEETPVEEVAPVDEVTPVEQVTIDPDTVISAALSVINVESFKEASLILDTAEVNDNFTLLEQDGGGPPIFTCPISGTSSIERGTVFNRRFNDCVIEGTRFNGFYDRVGTNNIALIRFDEISIVQENSQISIETGEISRFSTFELAPNNTWDWQPIGSFSSVASERSIDATISSMRMVRTRLDEYRAEFDATMTLDGTPYTISTTTPLESQFGDSFYTIGQIEISNDDGFNILIDADGGDPDSALITVTSNGSTESQSRAWSEQFFVDCMTNEFEPTIDCR